MRDQVSRARSEETTVVHLEKVTPRPGIVYGISANSRGWWDLSGARALGYQPQDDAEVFAERFDSEAAARPKPRSGMSPPPAPERVGGPFTSLPLGGPVPFLLGSPPSQAS